MWLLLLILIVSTAGPQAPASGDATATLLERYRAFQDLTEEEQARARANYEVFRNLSPEEQSKLRRRFASFRALPPEEQARRLALRESQPAPATTPGTAQPEAPVPSLSQVSTALLYVESHPGEPIPPAMLKRSEIGGVVLRAPWRAIEKKKGKYDWKGLDGRVARMKKAGKQVVLDLFTASYRAPDWLLETSGVKTVTLVVTQGGDASARCKPATIPVLWDPIFLERREALLRAAGEHFASKVDGVRLSLIDHFTDSWDLPHRKGQSPECGEPIDDLKAWKDAGYTTEKMRTAAVALLTVAAQAFPAKPLWVPLGPSGPLDKGPRFLARQLVSYGIRQLGPRFIPELPLAPGPAMVQEEKAFFQLLKEEGAPRFGGRLQPDLGGGTSPEQCARANLGSTCSAPELFDAVVRPALDNHPVYLLVKQKTGSSAEMIPALRRVAKQLEK